MKRPMTTVGEVLQDIVSGKSLQTLERPATNNEFGILKVSAVTWGEFRANENKAMPPDYNPGNCPRAMDGDILISRANTRELVGAPVMVEGDHPNLLLSDKLLKLIPNDTLVDRRYLLRALRSPAASHHFFSCAGGSSGSMTNITQGDIRSAPIPLPPLEKQRRIANILDKADALRTKRRESLAQIDRLTESAFIKMFGEPATNPQKLPLVPLEELIKLKSGDFLPASAMNEGGIFPVFGGNGVNGYHDDYMFDSRQIVIGRVGVYCGCVHVSPSKSWVTDNALYVSEMSPSLNFDYLAFSLRIARLNQYSSQSAQPLISGARIYPIKILVPPIEQQCDFVSKVTSINEIQVGLVESSKVLEQFFKSLQFRAFQGELRI